MLPFKIIQSWFDENKTEVKMVTTEYNPVWLSYYHSENGTIVSMGKTKESAMINLYHKVRF